MNSAEDDRFPKSVYGIGSEPDPRFSLANERTFLAWISISLALIASGVALQTLVVSLNPVLTFIAALVLIVGGVGSAVQAWFGWARAERAMRMSRPLPSAGAALPLAAIVIVAGLIVAAASIWR